MSAAVKYDLGGGLLRGGRRSPRPVLRMADYRRRGMTRAFLAGLLMALVAFLLGWFLFDLLRQLIRMWGGA